MRINLSLTMALASVALLTGAYAAAAQTRTTLDIYVVDVEAATRRCSCRHQANRC